MAIFNRIKFDGLRNRDWIIYKYPSENIVFGSQLIVGEGQAAIFVRNGQVCDVFQAGAYTLDTSNVPVLQSIFNLPFGNKTPFPAEIYYVNIATKMDLYWGTVDPIQIIDPKYFTKLRIRAFGQFALKIADYTLFFRELIGSMNMADIIKYDKVTDFYKGLLMTKVKTILADIIVNQKISALEISVHLEEISHTAFERVRDEFNRYGLTMVNFYIQSVNFPDEDFKEINRLLEQRAAFEIIGDNRYATKRTFDIYETAAGNENGVAGAFAAGGVGLGAGAAMASGIHPNLDLKQEEEAIACPQCGAANRKGAKFCSACGTPLAPKKCSCGAELKPTDKFCPECGKRTGDSL